MQYVEVNQMVESFGMPSAYRTFTKQTAKAPPYVVFYFDGTDDLYADNSNYQRIEQLVIEFYSRHKNFEKEKAIEKVLDEYEMTYTKSEVPIEDEKLIEIIYEMEVVINGE